MAHKAVASELPKIANAAAGRRADGDLVQSLMRGLTLLEILSDGGYRLKELAQRAGLAPSTTHRLLTTLEQKHFVRFDREDNLWKIGSNYLAIGARLLCRKNIVVEAVPRIERLARQLRATINLGVLRDGNLLILRQAGLLQYSSAQLPGSTLPVHATAMGKILLAGQNTQLRKALMSHRLNRLTDRTICDPSALARELHSVRVGGIALDNEESLAGRRCIGAPVYDEFGECVAAISVTAPRSQLTGTAISNLADRLASTASEITHSLGGVSEPTRALEGAMAIPR
jgi:IclR family transcriptional regulator, acetate operon repressor